MIFNGNTINGSPAFDRPGVDRACAKHNRFIIEVRKYDESAEISRQQMRYWHAVPIKAYAEQAGHSLWAAEQFLKRECGSQWFMFNVEEEESRRGQIMFVCQHPMCRHLFLLPSNMGGKYACPICLNTSIWMFFMLSKTELKVKEFNRFLENTWDFLDSIGCPVEAPNPEWRRDKKKGEAGL